MIHGLNWSKTAYFHQGKAIRSVIEKRWYWFDYVIIAVRNVWFVSRILEWQAQGRDLIDVWLITVAFALPLVAFCIKKLPDWSVIMAEWIGSGFILLDLASNLNEGLVFYCVPLFTIGYMTKRSTLFWSLPAAMVPLVLKAISLEQIPELLDGMLFDALLLYLLGFCFGYMKRSFVQLKEMNRIIQQQNLSLEHYAKQIEKLTLIEERNRLSRELHDTVGHTMTTTVMGMNAVRYLIDTAPEEAKRNLQELIQVTRVGLDEIRRHIHQLAPDKEEKPLSSVLSDIADDFARYTGTHIAVEVSGLERPVSEQIELALIRCLQESLTNAKRHGKADQVSVVLEFEEQALSLSVADNGAGTDQLVKGFGLQGMAGRMDQVGGSVRIDSKPMRGTTLTCRIPLPGSNRQD